MHTDLFGYNGSVDLLNGYPDELLMDVVAYQDNDAASIFGAYWGIKNTLI